jgi:hypothetical protein
MLECRVPVGVGVQVEAIGAVVELRHSQAQKLGEAAVDSQVGRVSERIRAHPGHADQRLVRARVEPAVRDLDIVSHLGSFRCALRKPRRRAGEHHADDWLRTQADRLRSVKARCCG